MIGDLIAAAIGRRIDRRDGEGGTLGALAGLVAWKATKRIVPAAIVIGGAVAGYRYLTNRLDGTAATG